MRQGKVEAAIIPAEQLPVKIGIRQRIFTPSGDEIEGVVTAASYIETQGEKGELFSLQSSDVGVREFYTSIQRDISDIKKHTGAPVEYMEKQPSDFNWSIYGEDVSAQKKICNQFCIHFTDFRIQGRGLYIYSACKGSGKTLLACCIANYLMRRSKMGVKFCSVTEYIERAKSKESLIELRNTDFLILDDIGSQSDKGERQSWIRELLFSLVDWRRNQCLSTIFTANVPIEKCSSDERTTQRIYEVSIPVKMPEMSIRKQKADASRDAFMRQIFSSGSVADPVFK